MYFRKRFLGFYGEISALEEKEIELLTDYPINV